MDIEQIYADIVAGTGTGGDLAWTRRDLRQLALHRAKTGGPDERLGALKVAALLGARDGLPIAHHLVADPDPRVRREAFELAVGARAEGLPSIRAAAGGVDPEVACEALDLLVRWVDAQAMPLAWRALASPAPGVRQRAAVLLGRIAGQGVTPTCAASSTTPTPPCRRPRARRWSASPATARRACGSPGGRSRPRRRWCRRSPRPSTPRRWTSPRPSPRRAAS
ncbi:MAG: hypothetical protein R3F59_06370 [Myxococcota bacterium]